MKRVILTALLLCCSTASHAAEWWWLGGFGEPPHNRYVDKESMQKHRDGIVDAWILDLDELPDPEIGTSRLRALERFDCRHRMSAPLRASAYTAEGGLVLSKTYDGKEFSPIAPDSADELVLHFVCQSGKVEAVIVPDPVAHSAAFFKSVRQSEAEHGAGGQENARAAAGDAASAAPAPGSEGTGTGFFVNAKGELVTAFHVVDGAEKIVVVTADGSAHPAEILRSSPATDLAVLSVQYRPARYLSLAAPGRAKPGDHIFTFGYPAIDVQGTEAKYTDGAISSLSGLRDEALLAQISIPVQPGNSGGPVVNDRGEVVGVVDAVASAKEYMAATGTLPQNVNWAVRGEYVIPLVSPTAPLPVRSREEAIALTRDAVALVWVKF